MPRDGLQVRGAGQGGQAEEPNATHRQALLAGQGLEVREGRSPDRLHAREGGASDLGRNPANVQLLHHVWPGCEEHLVPLLLGGSR